MNRTRNTQDLPFNDAPVPHNSHAAADSSSDYDDDAQDVDLPPVNFTADSIFDNLAPFFSRRRPVTGPRSSWIFSAQILPVPVPQTCLSPVTNLTKKHFTTIYRTLRTSSPMPIPSIIADRNPLPPKIPQPFHIPPGLPQLVKEKEQSAHSPGPPLPPPEGL